MAVLSCCDRFLVFVTKYIVSVLAMPWFGIMKIIYLIFDLIRNALRPVNSPEGHAVKVKEVQNQIVAWNASGRKTKMCTARSYWTSIAYRVLVYKKTMTGIRIDLGEIIEIDPINRTLRVEPEMSMGRLTSILIPMGWTLPVVPELNQLTVGGLLCGAGLETSSHKYGLFHNICISMEIVLASGKVVSCSKDNNSDLFYAIPGSHGTLGFLTAAELRIIPAEKYMRLEYMPIHSLGEMISTFESQTFRKSGNDFVEGIMFSLDKGVIMTGTMASEAEAGKVNSIGKWYKPSFYKHVESFLKKNPAEVFVDYIPLRDYYHRHTKCVFWVIESFVPFTNNVIFRYVLGWILPNIVFMLKLVLPEFVRDAFYKNLVLQDYIVPMELLKELLELAHEEMEVYPIWLCPAKLINDGPSPVWFLGSEDEMCVDFGAYGMSKQRKYEWLKSNRRLELFCIANRGYQATYSDVCMTREEFFQMFDSTHYFKVREQLNCSDAFPDIYEKVCRAARR